jgi:uncharacterized RmlC-like cupin family protein
MPGTKNGVVHQHVQSTIYRDAEIVTVRPEHNTLTHQLLPNFVGISADTAGSTGIAMNIVIVPAGVAAEPHLHRGHETAIFMLKGRVETRYGPGLKKSVINEAGDFIFIPADVPHQAVNMSDTEPAYAIVARNDPHEQESVIIYNPSRDQ